MPSAVCLAEHFARNPGTETGRGNPLSLKLRQGTRMWLRGYQRDGEKKELGSGPQQVSLPRLVLVFPPDEAGPCSWGFCPSGSTTASAFAEFTHTFTQSCLFSHRAPIPALPPALLHPIYCT